MSTELANDLTFAIIGAAMEVHTIMGPGFHEQVYQKSLEHELRLRGIGFEPQANVKAYYKGELVGDYYVDILVDNKVVVELKALAQLVPNHHGQVLNYLKASNLRLGLLFNFGEKSLVHRRVIHDKAKEKSV